VTTGDLLARLEATLPSLTFTDVDPSYGARLDACGVPRTLRFEENPSIASTTASVTLSGTLAGAGVLGSTQAEIVFTLDGTSYDLRLTLWLEPTWSFGQAFPPLQGGALDGLRLLGTPPAALVVASAATTDPRNPSVPLDEGMTFLGNFDASSPALASFAWLAAGDGIASDHEIVYDAARGRLQMQLPIAAAANTLPGTSAELSLQLSAYSGLDPAFQLPAAGILFEGSLQFGDEIGLAALLSDQAPGLLELTLTSGAFALPDAATVARYFGSGEDVAASLPHGTGSLAQVKNVTFGIGLASRTLEYASLLVGVGDSYAWAIGGGLSVTGPTFAFLAFDPLGDDPVYQVSFSATLLFGGLARVLVAGQTGTSGPTVISGRLDDSVDPPDVTALVESVFGRTNDLPVGELELVDLSFEADLADSAYAGAIEIAGNWTFSFGWDAELALRDLRIAFASDQGALSGSLLAALALGGADFAVSLTMTEDSTTFHGEWSADPASPGTLTYQDIALALGMYWLPDLPHGLDLSLASAAFTLDSLAEAPSFVFRLETSALGSGALIAGKDAAGNWGFIFGAQPRIPFALDVGDVAPLGGIVPPGSATIAIERLQVVAASEALPPVPQDAAVQALLGDDPRSGLALAVTLKIGASYTEELAVRLGGPDDRSAADAPPPGVSLPATRTDPAQPAPQAATANVQRAFGPLQVNRVDFRMSSTLELALSIDAAVTIGGLRLGLAGLEARVPLSEPYTPRFRLDGLEVIYSGGGLTIGGGLARVPGRMPETWAGRLTLSYGRFGAAAAGSYTTVDGRPSLFAFVWIDYPLGGPPAFFVTGLAGGFGFNQRLLLPTVSEVADYPLVKGAAGGSEADTLGALMNLTLPAEGQNWLAAGVRFTSFGMVDSSVLVTMSFGTHVEFALLGRSTVTVPAPVPGRQVPTVAQATIVVLARFDPDVGLLAIDAQLSPPSYVLSRDAMLSGGLAFYTWFAPSPQRRANVDLPDRLAGDFVLTLGGYHPRFNKPAHYPPVPRLALNWQLDGLTLKGELYFALTPAVLMLGGKLDANWSKGDLAAWFSSEVDFLVRFQPFAYSADMKVSIGASYKANLWLTTKKVTVHVGVTLSLWGPPFGGRAYVDLKVISFTIAFGARPPVPPKGLLWPDFRNAFLPPVTKAGLPASITVPGFGAPVYPTDSVITIGVPAGLRSGAPGAAQIVDPARLRLAVALLIPSTTATFAGRAIPGTWNAAFGIGPVGVARGGSTVATTITVQRDGQADTQSWLPAAVTGNVPAALWLNTTATLGGDQLVRGVLTGVTLAPSPSAPPTTVTVAVEKLTAGAAAPAQRPFAWSAAVAPSTDGFATDDPIQTLQQTLTDPTVAATRADILSALSGQGLTTADSVDVAGFAAAAEQLLSAPPELRLLGEQGAAT